ncbi:hypothetical protein SCA03_62980 [Streptomyces cacaoi]|uniref:Uncharacterized protein n=1 Tax=Streptomyces cacaoi TaxID=1898 RepID=A0A4Y3RAN6_STRCI|nr:hypothetical protein SCA03_62980 [Streptomyces cacaoi]
MVAVEPQIPLGRLLARGAARPAVAPVHVAPPVACDVLRGAAYTRRRPRDAHVPGVQLPGLEGGLPTAAVRPGPRGSVDRWYEMVGIFSGRLYPDRVPVSH